MLSATFKESRWKKILRVVLTQKHYLVITQNILNFWLNPNFLCAKDFKCGGM